MSAEDELTSYPGHPWIAVPDIVEYAEFWDDSESSDWNVQTIGWWLRQQIDETN